MYFHYDTEGSKSNLCCALLARQVRATFAWCTWATRRTYANFARNICVTYAPDSHTPDARVTSANPFGLHFHFFKCWLESWVSTRTILRHLSCDLWGNRTTPQMNPRCRKSRPLCHIDRESNKYISNSKQPGCNHSRKIVLSQIERVIINWKL
jgi:hypothetical protein